MLFSQAVGGGYYVLPQQYTTTVTGIAFFLVSVARSGGHNISIQGSHRDPFLMGKVIGRSGGQS